MIITDTHTHLYSESFDEDRDVMIQRAIDANVERFFIPAIDSTYVDRMYDLEKSFPDHVHLMMGLHPTHVQENYKSELQFIENQFQHQIQLAKKYKLPIVIHCREAFDEVFEILEEEKGDDLFGIFHCFTGTLEHAKKAISYNLKLGIGGVVTFKNGKIDKFLAEVPLKHIVLETDAPYLAPTPFRGKRNESSYIINVVEKLAEIYNMSLAEIAEITTQNSKDIFGI